VVSRSEGVETAGAITKVAPKRLHCLRGAIPCPQGTSQGHFGESAGDRTIRVLFSPLSQQLAANSLWTAAGKLNRTAGTFFADGRESPEPRTDSPDARRIRKAGCGAQIDGGDAPRSSRTLRFNSPSSTRSRSRSSHPRESTSPIPGSGQNALATYMSCPRPSSFPSLRRPERHIHRCRLSPERTPLWTWTVQLYGLIKLQPFGLLPDTLHAPS
jgi:hypothetical protein